MWRRQPSRGSKATTPFLPCTQQGSVWRDSAYYLFAEIVVICHNQATSNHPPMHLWQCTDTLVAPTTTAAASYLSAVCPSNNKPSQLVRLQCMSRLSDNGPGYMWQWILRRILLERLPCSNIVKLQLPPFGRCTLAILYTVCA